MSLALSTPTTVLLTAHLVATAAMVGLIWFVQVVHYPLLARVGDDAFVAYENAHTHLTSFVVGPFMAVEGATALWLALAPPDGVDRLTALTGLAVLGVIQVSTVLLQVPAHARLSIERDPAVIARLVRTNWIRTIGWTARGVIAFALLAIAAPH